ncbi:four-helix bundle copper-binding protein [Xylanimonas oleitrophica]|uniref:Four-helix bundle copper-binding protein n=2 Tax=Xylanimonas oleitrophica TaxID=2607479 RepID=A0A2W5WPW2_9MICO|nr:four-helix bundle copper-binding protein [Xylanimonas oleitrophica]
MMQAHPGPVDHQDLLAAAVDAAVACAQACTACADACLAEDMVADLRRCVRNDLDCADVCDTTARVLSRQTGDDGGVRRAVLEACITACRACGDECESHASMHEHCRVCAEACRACEQACRDLLGALG